MTRGPILPINIVIVIIILPSIERYGVIPVESPTVPKADITSNIILANGPGTFDPPVKSLYFSVIERVIVITTTISKAIEKIPIASCTILVGMVLLKIVTFWDPLIIAQEVMIIIINVQVLIPPPVDPGDAPINIRNIVRSTLGLEMAE